MEKYPPGKHPKSLQNLLDGQGKYKLTKENAREMQLKSAAKRKANNEARKRLQLTAHELKLDIDAVMEENNVSAIGVLKLAMVKAIQEEDFDQAADLAKTLAEFEKPKLARVESKIEEVKADDLTDEELDAKLREFKIVK